MADDISLEVNYNLSRLQLFDIVMHACQPLLIEELAEPLWSALELASELGSLPQQLPDTYLPFKIHPRGFVIDRNEEMPWKVYLKEHLKGLLGDPTKGLTWSWYFEDSLREIWHFNHPVGHGDVLYGLSNNEAGAGQVMMVSRERQTGNRDNHKKLSWDAQIAGLILTNRAENFAFLKGVFRNTHIRTSPQTFKHGPSVVDIPFREFLAIISLEKSSYITPYCRIIASQLIISCQQFQDRELENCCDKEHDIEIWDSNLDNETDDYDDDADGNDNE
ncbi:MAG: hypothetical protein M1822_007679 [Bathelium mastoideum]|nr:MAG: hypothetical protein M1822_007679 [Bathelium mastoideum]